MFNDVVLMFLLLTLNIFHTFSRCFYCWRWLVDSFSSKYKPPPTKYHKCFQYISSEFYLWCLLLCLITLFPPISQLLPSLVLLAYVFNFEALRCGAYWRTARRFFLNKRNFKFGNRRELCFIIWNFKIFVILSFQIITDNYLNDI